MAASWSAYYQRLRARLSRRRASIKDEPLAGLEAAWKLVPALPSTLASFRKLVVDLAAVVVAFVALLFVVSLLTERTVIIEAPLVPQSLQDRGITPELLTQLLQARIQEIHAEARSRKPEEKTSPANEPPKVETVGLNFSLSSVTHMAERIFDLESKRRLAISVMCSTPDCGNEGLSLHVVALADRVVVSDTADLDPKNLAPAIDLAAKHLLSTFDPYILSLYYFRNQLVEEAADIAANMVREGHEHEIWARNLLGVIAMYREDYASAGWHFEQALKVDPEFVPSLVNWGNARYFSGNLEGAKSFFERAAYVSEDDAFIYVNLGETLLGLCDWEGAARAFEHARAADPRYYYSYKGLAAIRYWADDDYSAAQDLDRHADVYAPKEKRIAFAESPDLLPLVSVCLGYVDPARKNLFSPRADFPLPDYP